MDFALFVDSVPLTVRALLGMLITVGISLGIALPLRSRAIEFDRIGRDGDDGDGDGGDDDGAEESSAARPARKEPSAEYLGGRVLGFVTTAFVFLLAFTFGQLWSNAQDAQTATQQENASYVRALGSAGALPAGPTRDRLIAAIQTYRSSVITQEWPQLQQADRLEAARAHVRAGSILGKSVNDATAGEPEQSRPVSSMLESIDQMIAQGNTRIAQAPGTETPGLILVIFLLGITMLALTAFLLPTRKRPYAAMIAMMAVLTSLLLFLVVEASNPFVGSGAVPVPVLIEG